MAGCSSRWAYFIEFIVEIEIEIVYFIIVKVGQHIGALDYLLPEEYVNTMKVILASDWSRQIT